MVAEGILLERKEWLITRCEKMYFDNLEKWFGHYCHIHCQVSLGRLINFPEQPEFSEEERKRFFAIYNGMAMDYVLVSKKITKESVLLSWMTRVMKGRIALFVTVGWIQL